MGTRASLGAKLCLGDFARAKFEEDVAGGLMDRVTLGEFKAKFGEHRAIASLAVIVEDEEKDKKRIIHDATHGVRVNHRINVGIRSVLLALGRRSRSSASYSVVARSPFRSLGISPRPAGDTSTRIVNTASWAARSTRRKQSRATRIARSST